MENFTEASARCESVCAIWVALAHQRQLTAVAEARARPGADARAAWRAVLKGAPRAARDAYRPDALALVRRRRAARALGASPLRAQISADGRASSRILSDRPVRKIEIPAVRPDVLADEPISMLVKVVKDPLPHPWVRLDAHELGSIPVDVESFQGLRLGELDIH